MSRSRVAGAPRSEGDLPRDVPPPAPSPAAGAPPPASPRGGPPAASAPPAGGRAPAPTILSHLVDAANLLTLAGLACTAAAILLAVRAVPAGAAICLVGSFVFDVVDGPVAARSRRRTSDQRAFGANLDSLADMASAGVALGVVVLAAGHFHGPYVVVAIALAAAAALRLSYFNVHGLDPSAGTYTGLPTDLAILSFTALMLLAVPLPAGAYRIVLALGGLAVAGLMVSSLRVPKLVGRPYWAVVGVAVALACAHAVRLA